MFASRFSRSKPMSFSNVLMLYFEWGIISSTVKSCTGSAHKVSPSKWVSQSLSILMSYSPKRTVVLQNIIKDVPTSSYSVFSYNVFVFKFVMQCAAVKIYRLLINVPPHLKPASLPSKINHKNIKTWMKHKSNMYLLSLYLNNAIQGNSNNAVIFPFRILSSLWYGPQLSIGMSFIFLWRDIASRVSGLPVSPPRMGFSGQHTLTVFFSKPHW